MPPTYPLALPACPATGELPAFPPPCNPPEPGSDPVCQDSGDTGAPFWIDACMTSEGCWGPGEPYACGTLEQLLAGPALSVSCQSGQGRGYYYVLADCGLPEAWQEFWFTTDTYRLIGAVWTGDSAMTLPRCCPIEGGGSALTTVGVSGWIP